MSRKSAALVLPVDPTSFDRVIVAVFLILAGLFALSPEQGQESFLFTGQRLYEVAPFLIGSIAIAAYAKASGADNLIARAFRGRIATMVMLAAFMGALSPFCSCGVIPLIAALLAMGVPLPAVMAFWLASPLMDPAKFVLSMGVLGGGFAIAQTVAAIGLGLLGGFGVLALQYYGHIRSALRDGIGDGGCAGSNLRAPGNVLWRFWTDNQRRRAFRDSTLSNTLFLGKWLALAFLLESLMLAYVPAESVVQVLGSGDWLTVAMASLIGIPAYLNGYAAMPLVAGLIEQGMAPGAGMAFLIAGGVTSIPAAVAVFALARLPVFFAYLAFALVGSVLAGLTYGLLV
jgi:uncharacterized membrane protein YraQ (UPF0718 family)